MKPALPGLLQIQLRKCFNLYVFQQRKAALQHQLALKSSTRAERVVYSSDQVSALQRSPPASHRLKRDLLVAFA